MLRIKNLSFSFSAINKKNLINNLTFSIKKGEIKIICGKSGLGKTTLLNILSGIKVPSLIWKGKVFLNSLDITDFPIEKRKIGLLMQDRVLFPHFRVIENLLFAIPKNVSRKEVLIENYLDKIKMSGLENYFPSELSIGQITRIACLRTFLSFPNAILLDEPFASLDAKSKKLLKQFVIDEIKIRKIPCIIVSHDKKDYNIGDEFPINIEDFKK